MTGTPERAGTADNGTGTAGDRHGGQIREGLEQDQERAVGAIASERRDARDSQDRTDTQRRDAREAQDQIDVAADTQRRDAREAQDQIDLAADTQRRDAREAQDSAETAQDTQRRDAREAQDSAETAQDSERQDAQDSFDTRRDEERHDAFEQKVADYQQVDALEQSNQLLTAFAYTASHDLRAPLRTMSGYSAVLLEEYGPSLGAEGRDYAEKIHAASQQMGQLLDALLRLSRLSRAEVCLEPVDLGAEAAAIAAELQAAEPWRQVRFTIQQPAWAVADRPLIRTVLQNLLGNAWKFTSGQDNAQIELATVPDGDTRIRCYIRDNGAGFDPAQAGKLFTAFQRLHPASQFPGTGIGLASVRQIVKLHGGQVGAAGTIGEGATFSFTLAAADLP
jgi:signal transduction histidine kinase